jgi:hypothetical protein
MRKFISAFVALTCLTLISQPAARATQLLYVYEGAGCAGVANLPQFEAFLGRPVDGVDDYVDYLSDWPTAVSGLSWTLGCWRGSAPNIAYGVPLAVNSYTPTPGSNQLADVAAGKMDTYFSQIGAMLVSNGFPKAYIRLGWEEDGGWYAWSAAAHPADFAAAFAHVMKLLKATPGSHFTVLYNPAAYGDASVGFPATPPDMMGWDVYANTYGSGGAATEPAMWAGDYGDWWGIDSIGNGTAKEFHGELSVAIPEFGVGAGAGGVGAPSGFSINAAGAITGAQVKNGGDDPYYMRQALAYFAKVNAAFVGYWDYDDGSGSLSKISDGSRPQEALEFLKVYGSAGMKAIVSAYASPFTTQTPPTLTVTNCHAVAFQNGPGHWMIVVWATDAHPSASVTWTGKTTNANVYNPASASPTTPVQALGAASSWAGVLTPNQPVVIAVAQ